MRRDYTDYPDQEPPPGHEWVKAEHIEVGDRIGPFEVDDDPLMSTIVAHVTAVEHKPRTVWIDIRGQAGIFSGTFRQKPKRGDWLAVAIQG